MPIPTFLRKLFFLLMILVISYQSYGQLTSNFDICGTCSKNDCPPFQTTFVFSGSGTPTAYDWTINGVFPTTYSTSSPTVTFQAPGTFNVSLRVKDASGNWTPVLTKTGFITVKDTPKVDFTATPVSGCAPLSVNFQNNTIPGSSSGSSSYVWSTGVGTSTANAPTGVVYPSAGTYNVILSATNGLGCTKSKTKISYINVNAKPAVDFSASNTNFCAPPANVSFSPSVTGTSPFTYAWLLNIVDPTSTSASPNPTYTYTGASGSSYGVKLTVTDAKGCSETVIKPNYINILKPKALFSSPPAACIGTVVNFNSAATTPTNATLNWDFGGGNTTTGPNPAFIWYSSGIKSVRLVADYGGCTDTMTRLITIYPQPVADFDTKPDSPCPAPAPILFIPNSLLYTNYAWDFGDGTTPPLNTQVSPNHTYNTNGFFSPTLYVTDVHGCKDTITKIDSVRIYDYWVRSFPVDTGGCIPMTVKFFMYDSTNIPQVYNYPYQPPQSVLWDFSSAGGPAATTNSTFTFTTQGTYKIYVRVISKNGCPAIDSSIIRVGSPPSTSFTIAPTRICFGGFTTIAPTVTGLFDYWWVDWGDGPSSLSLPPVTPTVTHKYHAIPPGPGKYTITLGAINNGCIDTFMAVKVLTIDSPGSEFAYKYSCDTLGKVNFIDAAIGATSRIWYFGDGPTSTSTAASPSHTYAAINNVYNVMLVTFNSRSGCSDTIYHTVAPNDPKVTVTADDTAVCVGDTVHFTSTFTGAFATAEHFIWQLTNPVGPTTLLFFDSMFKLTTPFPTAGYYKVKVTTIDDRGCMDSTVRNNYIFVSKPSITFGASPTLGCTNLLVNFKDTSTVPTGTTIVSKFWDFGNGTGSVPPTVSTASQMYTVPGSYDVKLVVKDALGCADSFIRPQYINAHKPKAYFLSAQHWCMGDVISFSNNSSGSSFYTWDFGDGSGFHPGDPMSYSYKNVGTYDVTLIATDTFGCKDTFLAPGQIIITKPVASFTMSDSISACPPPFIVNFNSTSTGAGPLTYKWDLGNGYSKPNGPSPSEAYIFPKADTIVLIVKDKYGCPDTAKGHVNLLGYAGLLTYSPLLGCNPLTVNFNSLITNLPGITWDFSDGNVQPYTGSTTTHTYTNPGRYLPKLVLVDNKNCKTASQGVDTIKVDAAIAAFRTGPACEFQDVLLYDTSRTYFMPITAWTWTFDDGSKQFKNPAKHHYGAAGNYPVKLWVQSSIGCIDSVTQDVIIHKWPEIDAGADTIICLKDSAVLNPSGGISYVWSPSSYLDCTNCTNPKAGVPKRFTYQVVGTDANGCTNKDTVSVNIKLKVTSEVSKDGEICDKDTISMFAIGGQTYLWIPAEGLDDPTASHPIASPHKTTIYTNVAYEGSCIPDTNNVKITVHPLPTVKAEGTQTIIAGQTAEIHASGDLIRRFAWMPAYNLNCPDCAAPTAKPSRTTTYVVTVYSDFNCVDSDNVTVTVLCDQSQLFMPNTFTPNGDGQNDIFYPRGTGLDKVKSFRVYNRWGEMVFERTGIPLNDQQYGWDGTFKGAILPPDAFVYVIEAFCDNGEIMIIKGDVTILR